MATFSHQTSRPAALDRPQERGNSSPTVSVIIPTLNEAENLPWVLGHLPDIVDEVVIVDGRSTDETIDVALRLRPDARIVLEKRHGKGIALKRGFEEALGDIVVTLDADGSMNPGEIPAFVGALCSGFDYAKGSRFIQGGGTDDMELRRKAGNWMLRATARVAFGGHYSDLCYGYNAFWRDLLPVFEGEASGFEIETFLNLRALSSGLRITEVPSFEAPRLTGNSNLRSIPDGMRVLRTIIRERLAEARWDVDALETDTALHRSA